MIGWLFVSGRASAGCAALKVCAAEFDTRSSRAASTRPIATEVTAISIPEKNVFLPVAILALHTRRLHPRGRISSCRGPVTVAVSDPT